MTDAITDSITGAIADETSATSAKAVGSADRNPRRRGSPESTALGEPGPLGIDLNTLPLFALHPAEAPTTRSGSAPSHETVPAPGPGARTAAQRGRVRANYTYNPGDRVSPTGPPSVDRAERATASAGSEGELDWSQVAAFRARASEQLTAALASDRGRVGRAEQESLGRAIIAELLDVAVAESLHDGADPWPPVLQARLAAAVFDALFRLGRLQPLVDDDTVENVIICGHDNVVLELIDGTMTPGPAVADSDAELIEFLGFLASRSEVNARPFSEAQPRLHLRLDGGARLAAVAWVTPRPSVVIRRHRLHRVTLDDLVQRGSLTAVCASFLRAAVRARKSIVVTGAQGSGKTTMVRALCAEIGPWEAIGTFETEYELHLHELTDQHRVVHAWESRPGSGEVGPDGRHAGEFTLDEAMYDSFRFNLSRQIVGEVRGREVWAMIKAMESGAGSISTTHAAGAEAGIRKLVTCAMEAGSHVTQQLATSKLAETIDLVVHLHMEVVPGPDDTARRDRWVEEILAIAPGEQLKGYATTQVFAPAPGRPSVPGILPDALRDLEPYGFRLQDYLDQGTTGRGTR